MSSIPPPVPPEPGRRPSGPPPPYATPSEVANRPPSYGPGPSLGDAAKRRRTIPFAYVTLVLGAASLVGVKYLNRIVELPRYCWLFLGPLAMMSAVIGALNVPPPPPQRIGRLWAVVVGVVIALPASTACAFVSYDYVFKIISNISG